MEVWEDYVIISPAGMATGITAGWCEVYVGLDEDLRDWSSFVLPSASSDFMCNSCVLGDNCVTYEIYLHKCLLFYTAFTFCGPFVNSNTFTVQCSTHLCPLALLRLRSGGEVTMATIVWNQVSCCCCCIIGVYHHSGPCMICVSSECIITVDHGWCTSVLGIQQHLVHFTRKSMSWVQHSMSPIQGKLPPLTNQPIQPQSFDLERKKSQYQQWNT